MVERHTGVVAYLTAGLTAALGGLTLQDWALLTGMATALGTFLVNWWYKRLERRDKLAVRNAAK